VEAGFRVLEQTRFRNGGQDYSDMVQINEVLISIGDSRIVITGLWRELEELNKLIKCDKTAQLMPHFHRSPSSFSMRKHLKQSRMCHLEVDGFLPSPKIA